MQRWPYATLPGTPDSQPHISGRVPSIGSRNEPIEGTGALYVDSHLPLHVGLHADRWSRLSPPIPALLHPATTASASWLQSGSLLSDQRPPGEASSRWAGKEKPWARSSLTAASCWRAGHAQASPGEVTPLLTQKRAVLIAELRRVGMQVAEKRARLERSAAPARRAQLGRRAVPRPALARISATALRCGVRQASSKELTGLRPSPTSRVCSG